MKRWRPSSEFIIVVSLTILTVATAVWVWYMISKAR